MTPSAPSAFRRFRALALAAACVVFTVMTAQAQFTYSEDFKNSTAAGWVLNPAGNSTPNVVLTSGAATRAGDPETGGTIDPTGAGWLRLTNNTNNLHNAVFFDTPIPSAGNSVNVQFGVNMFGGNNFAGTGADGLTFFLYDASKSFVVGANGGSIGYAQKDATQGADMHDGMNGGFIAVALDAYGNFSVNGEGRQGGTATLQPNSVAVRGPGQGQTGYDYLAGTGNRDLTDTGSPTTLDAGDGTVPAVPYTMAFAGAAARPDQSTQYRNVSVTIDENSQLSVSMQFGEDGLWYNLLNVDVSSFVRPEQLKLGFSAGTGGGTQVYEVGGLLKIEATAGSGNFVWDNGEGSGSKIWGTGANNPLNWAGNTNPTLKSNVIFNSAYISSAQAIDVTGSDKVIQNLYFSGANAYTLTTSEARKLIFDSSTVGGLTAINLTNDVAGNTSHTVGLDIQMNRNLDINNNIAPTFTITGNIDNGGNVLGLKGTGTTVLAGAISGSGSITKIDSGTTILNGASANTYTGATTISGGILQIEKATALGSTASGTTVNSGGTLALAGAGTTFAAEGLTISGTGDGGNGALRNISGNNTWTGTVALGATGANTIGVDGSTNLSISGVVSGAAGNNLVKVGTGTLNLGVSNTYSGSTTINAGTVAIGADSGLGTAPGTATAGQLTLNGGALQNTASLTLNANRGVALGADGGTFNTNSGTTLTYNGIIAGSSGGALNKAGTGTLTLGGVSTYNGATNITAGTLQLGVNNALPTGTAVSVSSGATFDLANRNATIGSLAGAGNTTLGSGNVLTVNGAANTTYSGVISGSGGVTKQGAGNLTLSGGNTFTGTLNVNGGTVTAGASNVLSNSSTLQLSGGTYALGGNFTDTIGNLSLTANSSINYNGTTSALTFTNANRTAGVLTIDGWAGNPTGGGFSQLVFGNAATGFTGGTVLNEVTFTGWGTGAIRLASGEIVPNLGGTIYTYALPGNGNWNVDNNWSDNGLAANADPGTFAQNAGDTAIFGSSATGAAAISLNGANRTLGYLVFDSTQNHTLSGNNLVFDVNGGSAQLVNQNTGTQTISSGILLSDSLVVSQNGSGTLTLSGAIANQTGTNNVTVNGTTNTAISGAINIGAGTLTKEGAGTLTLSSTTSTFTGAININGGVLAISNELNLGATASTANLTLDGGTLRSQGSAVNIATSGRNIVLGANGGTFDTVTNLTLDNPISGAGSLTKTGAATLFLTDPNTYTGATNINAGTLAYGAGADRIADVSAVTVASGATFDVVQYSDTIGSLAGAGTLTATGTGTAAITFGGLNTDTTFSGTITDGASATLGLVKQGTGKTILSGVNSYDGTTTVSAGTLNVQNATGLGTTTGGTTVASGATLELQHGTGIAIGNETLALSGTGVGGNGALRNISGANSIGGSITLGAATEIQSDAGTLTLGGAIGGTNQNLTLDGAGNITANGIIGTGTGTLTKNGTGYAILAGANTFTGATSINAGTLQISNNTGLGTTAAGTTVASGATLALSNNITSAEGLTVSGTGVDGAGALRNVSGGNTLSGAIALGGAAYVGVDGSSTLTTSGVISGSFDLTKVGTGTLIMSGSANTYTGTTAVTAGTLEIRQAGQLGTTGAVTTVSDLASLRLNASGATVAENVTLVGSGVSGAGALQNTGGNNTWSGNLTMSDASAIGSTAGTTLNLTGTLGGAFDFVKVGDGGLTLSAAAGNSYTGTTTVRGGTLTVTTSAPIAGNGSLGNSGTTVQLGDSGTAGGSNLSFLIGNATGGVSVDRAISVNNFGAASTLGGANTSGTNTFSGDIGLGKNTTLTAATGGTVNFNGTVSGTGGITAGSAGNTGTLVLDGNNSYAGATTVAFGTLVAGSNNALGGTSATTTVNSGATLGLQGGITLPAAETLTISGTGFGSVGALNNVANDNTISGNVAMAASSSIGSASGSLAINGVVSGSGFALTKVGAGEVVLNGSAANTYSGATIVNAGTLTLAKTGAGLNAATGATGGVTVNTGGTIALGADDQISNSVTLTLAGGTFVTNNNSDTIGSLSLTASSSINFSSGDTSILTFTNASRTAGTLTIDDWNGVPTVGGGGSRLMFTNAGTGFGTTDIAFTGFGAGWTRLASGEIVPVATSGTTYTWTNNGSGAATNTQWNQNGNWSSTPDGFPGAANDTAIFGNGVITANRTISLNGTNRTLGYLVFSGTNANQFAISDNSLNFDVTAGNAQIQVDDTAAPTINSGIILNDNLNISSSSTGMLTVNGGITGTGGTRNLSVNGSGTVDINGVIGASMGTLTKGGTGTLILNGANTYTGATTINNGTIQLDANAPSGSAGTLGNATSAVVLGTSSSPSDAAIALVSAGGATGGITVGRNLTVNNFGGSTTIGGTNTGGTNTFSGTVTLNKDATLTAAAGGTVAFTGAIAGTGGIVKDGAGTVSLAGTAQNTFTGDVAINAGTLQVAKTGAGVDALPASTNRGAIGDQAAVTIASGASLTFNGDASQVLEEIGSLTGSTGANVNNTQATALTLYTGQNNASTLYAGTITDTGGNLTLVKQGSGTMTLSGANAYDGSTTVSAGTLVAAHNTALGTSTGNTTVNTGATLGLQGNITITGEQMNLAAAASPSTASLANLSGTNTSTGNISLTGTTANDQVKIDVAGSSQLTLSGVISEGTNAKVLAKTGTGTLVVSGNNTYTGSTNITAGTLVAASNNALGTTANGTSVQIGATLGVQGNITLAAGEALALYGAAGTPSAPSIKNIQDTNTINGAVTLNGGINTGVAIESTAGSLTLNGAITQASNPNFVVKTGAGSVTLGGTTANTFSGGFTINEGTVIAAKTAGVNATGAGGVNVGDGTGAAASATLQLNASNQIADSSNVTIATDGRLALQGNSDTIGALTMGGGSVTGTGTLTVGGNVTFNGVGSSTASIGSNLDLGTTGTRIVQVGNNGVNGDTDLTISGTISGGTGSFNKTDLGTLAITGTTANTFSGGFQVSDGTVLLNKTAGLNATGTGNVTVGDGSGAAGTAVLKLLGSNQIADTSRVTIQSDGKLDVNGLTETIGSFAGAGTIDTGTGGLLIAGGDNTSTSFGGALAGTGTIRKVGSGDLTFTSNINFSGGELNLLGGELTLAGTSLNVGTLRISGNTILDFGNSAASTLTATNVIIENGATLTITNWVHMQDFFYATGAFYGLNTTTGVQTPVSLDVRGVAPQNQVQFNGFSGNSTIWQSLDHQITPAPEPATYGAIMMGAALGFLGYRRWKKTTLAAKSETTAATA